MYHMVLLVIDDLNNCPAVFDAWEAAGVPGITILESTGLGRVRQLSLRDDLPLMLSITHLLQSREERHRTIFTVVEGEAMVNRLIEVTQSILGDLEEADNGVLFVLPVSQVVGLHGGQKRAAERR